MNSERISLSALLVAAVCIPALSLAATLPGFDRVLTLREPVALTDHRLVSHEGKRFSLTDLRGRPALVFFGFTNCPDVCPATLLRMQSFFQARPDIAERVAFLLISVDGDRDTPEVLDAFLGGFDDRFLGATAETAVIQRVAKEFRAPFYKSNPSGEDRSYTVAHSPAVFLLDGDGRLRAEFHSATPQAMAGVIDALLEEG